MPSPMKLRATPEFLAVYDRIADRDRTRLDGALERLSREHYSDWARRNRVVGSEGAAWLIEVAGSVGDLALYWRLGDDGDSIDLLLLLRR